MSVARPERCISRYMHHNASTARHQARSVRIVDLAQIQHMRWIMRPSDTRGVFHDASVAVPVAVLPTIPIVPPLARWLPGRLARTPGGMPEDVILQGACSGAFAISSDDPKALALAALCAGWWRVCDALALFRRPCRRLPDTNPRKEGACSSCANAST